MECVCAPTAKDTVIVLSEHEGQSSIGGYVKVNMTAAPSRTPQPSPRVPRPVMYGV